MARKFIFKNISVKLAINKNHLYNLHITFY